MDKNTPFSDIYLSKAEIKTLKSFLKTPEQEYNETLYTLIYCGFITDKGKIVNGYDMNSGIYVITHRGKNYLKYNKEHSVSSIILVLTLIFSILAVIKEELIQLIKVIIEQLV